MFRAAGPTYVNGMRAPGVNAGVWLSMSEEEFALELRRTGWSEGAIERELETLRAYVGQFQTTRPQPTLEISEYQAVANPGLKAILEMRKRKKQLKDETLGVDDGSED